MANNELRKKDFWDKFSKISTFLSTVIVVLIGIIVAEVYKDRQDKRDNQIKQHNAELRKIEILEKFMPHLASGDTILFKTALLAIYELGLDSIAIQLATYSPKPAGTEALVEMYTHSTKESNKQLIRQSLIKKAEQGNIQQKTLTHTVFKGYHWILNNGHGIHTENKYSLEYEPDKRVNEGEINRIIVNKLSNILKQKSIDHTILVEETDDIPIIERINRINNLRTNKPRILLSVHANFSSALIDEKWGIDNGIEIWNSKGITKADNLSEVFLEELILATNATDRGIKEADFFILRKVNIPNILIEIGFIDNKEELKKLLSDEYQNKIVEGFVNAIERIDKEGLK